MTTDVALVVVHDSVAELPAVIAVGLTVKDPVGGGIVTCNVAEAVAVPVLLVAVSV